MIDVHIPKFGMSTVEVDVTAVLVKPGDHVNVGHGLIEIESEKAMTIVEADVAGTVREVLVGVDDVARVGDVFCRIEPDA